MSVIVVVTDALYMSSQCCWLVVLALAMWHGHVASSHVLFEGGSATFPSPAVLYAPCLRAAGKDNCGRGMLGQVCLEFEALDA